MTNYENTQARGNHRLFFALWPSDEVRQALVRAADNVPAFNGAGRRVPPARLHLTLQFLGSSPSRADDMIQRASAAAATVSAEAFELHVDHAGNFPGARVGWLAPAANGRLDALWRDLRAALDERAFRYFPQSPFVPHITTFRGIRGCLSPTPIDPIAWPVQSFVLVHSHDGRYDVLSEWLLQ